jgi:hypothetical protein
MMFPQGMSPLTASLLRRHSRRTGDKGGAGRDQRPSSWHIPGYTLLSADSGCSALRESHEVADSESAERPSDDGRDEMEAFVAFDESSTFVLS